MEVINNEDYKLKVTKTWLSISNVWHIEFLSQSVYDHTFELYLTEEELQRLRDVL